MQIDSERKKTVHSNVQKVKCYMIEPLGGSETRIIYGYIIYIQYNIPYNNNRHCLSYILCISVTYI